MTQREIDVPRYDAVALTRALVRIDSRNPVLAAGAPGESGIATALGKLLDTWGFAVDIADSVPGRPNLVARIGPADTPAMILAGHLDTVGVEGMTHDPFSGDIAEGRIYGRGSADMKAGLAAMCVAAARAYLELDGKARRQIVIAAVADEEYDSVGLRALLARGFRGECAILTEPTRLAICTAHRGFVWTEVEFTGRAAHGSRYDIGVDAIRHAGLVLSELDALDAGKLHERTHPLLGRGSLHASTIEGGVGMSTYPDRCTLRLERRTIPGEGADEALEEIRIACESVRQRNPGLSATVKLMTAQAPSDVESDADVVKRLARGLRAEGLSASIEGLSAWTDAALLNEAGITAVCFGPGDIAFAHAAEEYVPVSDIDKATAVLGHVAREWMTSE